MKIFPWSAALVVAAAVIACAAPAGAQQEADASRIAAGVSAYVDGFNNDLAAGRLDRWIEIWADNAERRLPDSRQSGKREIRAAYRKLYEAYVQMRLREVKRSVRGGAGIWEGVFEGTLKSNGNPIQLPVTITLEFDLAGKIRRMSAEYDVEAAMEQFRRQTA